VRLFFEEAMERETENEKERKKRKSFCGKIIRKSL
jgi:hypothetical protein